MGGRGWRVPSRTGHVVPTGSRPDPGLSCSRPPPPQPVPPGHRRAPACVRSRRGSQFGPPGASLPRSGNWGPGLAHAPPAPRARGAGGWEWQSFFPRRWAALPAHPPPSPRRKARLHLPWDSWGDPQSPCPLDPGARGTPRHLRAPRVDPAARTPPESSDFRMRCSCQPADASTCLSLSLFFFFFSLSWEIC